MPLTRVYRNESFWKPAFPGSQGMHQATGVMGWQWSHFLACSPILLESLLSSGLLSWQGILRILPTHAYSLCAISRPYREEHGRKDPSYPMSCYTFPVRPVLQSCHSLSYSEKKKKKETIVLFCFPEKEIDLKLSKNIDCLIFCVKLLFSLVVILQLWLMNFGIRFISALGHLLIKKLHCLL